MVWLKPGVVFLDFTWHLSLIVSTMVSRIPRRLSFSSIFVALAVMLLAFHTGGCVTACGHDPQSLKQDTQSAVVEVVKLSKQLASGGSSETKDSVLPLLGRLEAPPAIVPTNAIPAGKQVTHLIRNSALSHRSTVLLLI